MSAGGAFALDAPESIPEIARRRLEEISDRDAATRRHWCVWNPVARAWYESAPGALEVTFTENIELAYRFTRGESVEIWIRSGYDDVPVPVAAARELMATLDVYASTGISK